MPSITSYISEIKRMMSTDSPRAFIALLTFADETTDDYEVSALPYAMEQVFDLDRAFVMQSTFLRVIDIQEMGGERYQGRSVGVVVSDPASFETAELLAEALLGALRKRQGKPRFAYAADGKNWVEITSGANGSLREAES